MKITGDDSYIGNRAMAHALLLYYQLIKDGGFTNDQTVYIDRDHFDAFGLLDVEVEDGYEEDIEPEFLKEAAIIFLLSDLDDYLSEFEDDFWLQPHAKKIISCFKEGKFKPIPETDALFENILKHNSMSFADYRWGLKEIYKKYVLGRMRKTVSEVNQENETLKVSLDFVNLEDKEVG